MVKTYTYDAFGNELNKVANDTNPFRYAGEYHDLSSSLIYLRNRYYEPSSGRFISAYAHWNPQNMLYGDSPVKIKDDKDAFGQYVDIFKPDLLAIRQSSNLYPYALNNPNMYRDSNGDFVQFAFAGAEAAAALGGGAAFGSANFWNPVGWAVLGAVAVTSVGLGVYYANNKSTQEAQAMLSFAFTAATPPPPNAPKSRGTQTCILDLI